MPVPLFVGLVAAIGALAADVVLELVWYDEGWWSYVAIAIDLAAIGLFASLDRRSEKITGWVRSIALVWGVVAAYLAPASVGSMPGLGP
jgi:hypothetical protein